MLSKLMFYTRMGFQLIKSDVVGKEDYRREYDQVSETYEYWLKEMGRYTDHIIHSEYIGMDKELKILDFACGTGYITKSLLAKSKNYQITAVDQSEKMLAKLRMVRSERATVICSDGIEFLEACNEKYDVIFFGWALSYFDYHKLFKLFNKVLKPGGRLAIITNTEGTLDKIEKIFLQVMAEQQEQVIKPMDIKLNLPKGKKGLIKWCHQYGFKVSQADEGEVIFRFKEPEALLQWLNKTGAAAGTRKIFRNYEDAKPFIIQKIEKEKYNKGHYEINHKFAYGLFRKELSR